tara:strand:- start:701 stop:883 length:183 start_codon:yes stop_codon:yes gene_type:complete
VALIHINAIIIIELLSTKYKGPIGPQPPRNRIVNIILFKMILEYSAKKKRAKAIEEYSTL